MALEPITEVRGRAVVVPGNDIDTDRIIPARFMKCVTFDGLGRYAFYDARFDEQDRPRAHPLNDPRFEGASILVSGRNFGCGSSREHAPQALAKAGFRAVLAESFAEIFFGNSTTLGMPCMTLAPDDIARVAAAVEADPAAQVCVDVAAGAVRVGDALDVAASIPDAQRTALVSGNWDPIGQLLEGADRVRALADELPYLGFA